MNHEKFGYLLRLTDPSTLPESVLLVMLGQSQMAKQIIGDGGEF
jgi:hypothetical protein